MDHDHQHPAVIPPVTVMFVDDDPFVRSMIEQLLGTHPGLNIAGIYASGADALAAAAAEPPQVMVVDITMPEMNGIELTRLMQEQHPETKVLGYTSLADEQSISRILSAGASGILYKEAPVASVAEAIRSTYGGLSVLSPRFRSGGAQPEPPAEPTDLADLTDIEAEILHHLVRGLNNERIGQIVQLSPWTVRYHVEKLSRRLGAHNRLTLAVAATRLGITP